MFVYQNVNRDICVTFDSNKPVKTPDYVISIDHENHTITINGQVVAPVEEEPVEETTVVEETDSVVEEDEPTPDQTEDSVEE